MGWARVGSATILQESLGGGAIWEGTCVCVRNALIVAYSER